MKVVVMKLIFDKQDDINGILRALEAAGYFVVATSRVIFDAQTKKHHQFLGVMKNGSP